VQLLPLLITPQWGLGLEYLLLPCGRSIIFSLERFFPFSPEINQEKYVLWDEIGGASMNIDEIRHLAKAKLAGICRVCPSCDGRACAGQVPGVGGVGTGTSFKRNVEALQHYQLNLRTNHEVTDPSLEMDLWGNNLKMPVIGAAIAGGKLNYGGVITDQELAQAFVQGCRQSGTVGMIGDGPDLNIFKYGLEQINETGGWGIPVIKPRDQKEILERVKLAEDAGCLAVAIDVDAAGLINMRLAGVKAEPKSTAKLREVAKATHLPLILKGIMTADEAEKAVEAGAKAIVVSNHGGRVLDHTPGTVEVLEEITHAVKNQLLVFVDGGIRSGTDVLKCLALGAQGVLIGRPLALGAVAAGSAGVATILEQIRIELTIAMIMTGVSSVKTVPAEIVRLAKTL